MSDKTIQKNEIFAFEKGKCILLKDFKNILDTNKYDLGDQMTNLIQVISSLSQTVNQNAHVLKQMGRRVDQNEFHLMTYLQQANGNYLQHYDDGLQQKQSEINEDEFMGFLLERNEILQNKMLECISNNNKFKGNIDNKFELFQTQQSQICYQMSQIEEKQQKLQNFDAIKKLKEEFEYKINQIQVQVDGCCSIEFTNRINHELKFQIDSIESEMLDKFNDIYQRLDLQNNNGLNSTSFDYNQVWEQINTINDQLKNQLQYNKTYDELFNDFNESQRKQKKHSKILKKLLKNKIPEQNQQHINNLEKIVFSGEQNNVSLINKNIKKISLLQDQLDLKINKAQFFEFVAENFVRSKDYQNFQKNVLNNINTFKSLQNEHQKNLQQFQYDLNDKIDDCYNYQEDLSKKVQDNSKDILKIRSIESQGEKMYHSLEKKIEKLKAFFIDTYSQKLNALTTAQGIKCLSCGERDIPFPPQSKFIKERKQTNRFSYNKEYNKYDYIKCRKPKEQIQAYNKKFSIKIVKNKNYMIGPQVFNKQHQVVEHYFKTHLPVDQLIEQKLYRKPNKRPQTSIPKFQR